MEPTPEKPHETIVRAVAQYFQIPQDELMVGRSKKTTDTYRRYVCFYLIKENINKVTWPFIADVFAQRHSNVQYGYNKIASEKEIYRQTLKDINNIQALIDKFNILKQEQLLA